MCIWLISILFQLYVVYVYIKVKKKKRISLSKISHSSLYEKYITFIIFFLGSFIQ